MEILHAARRSSARGIGSGFCAALLFAACEAQAAQAPAACQWSRIPPPAASVCRTRVETAVKTNAPCVGAPPEGFFYDYALGLYTKIDLADCDRPPWISGMLNYDAPLYNSLQSGRHVAKCSSNQHLCWTKPDGAVCDLTAPACWDEYSAFNKPFDDLWKLQETISPADARAAVGTDRILYVRQAQLNWLKSLSPQSLELWIKDGLGAPCFYERCATYAYGGIIGLNREQWIFLAALTHRGLDLTRLAFSAHPDMPWPPAGATPTTAPSWSPPILLRRDDDGLPRAVDKAAAASSRASDSPRQWPQVRGSDGRSYPMRVDGDQAQIYIGGRWRALSGTPPAQWIEINGRRVAFSVPAP